MRVRRILLDEHEERIRREICPRCNKFSLQRSEVKTCQSIPKAKYKFVEHFWSCAGPDSFNCYFISSDLGDTLFESSEGVDVINFDDNPKTIGYLGAKIIKRRKNGERVEISPQAYVL
jgi:hypothetical protein